MPRHESAYDLSDAEKRDLIKLIEQGRPLNARAGGDGSHQWPAVMDWFSQCARSSGNTPLHRHPIPADNRS